MSKRNPAKKKPKVLRWILVISMILIVAYLGIGAYIAYSATLIDLDTSCIPTDTPATFDLAYSNVKFKARGDDLTIGGWYIPNEDADKALIIVHGRNGSKQIAATCNFPKLGAELHDAGFAVLMIDTRGHGDSEGKRYSFGYYESMDVLGAVDFLLGKGFSPRKIGALGMSNGSGAVIGAAAEDDAIGALVLDSVIADMGEVITDRFTEETGFPVFLLNGAQIMGQILLGYDFMEVKPVEEIISVPPRPILMLHCSVDEIVGFGQAELIKEAIPQAELIVFDDCSHAELYRDYPQEYLDATVALFQDGL